MGRKTKDQIRKDKATARSIKCLKKNFKAIGFHFAINNKSDMITYNEIKSHTARKDYIVSLVLKDIEERKQQG